MVVILHPRTIFVRTPTYTATLLPSKQAVFLTIRRGSQLFGDLSSREAENPYPDCRVVRKNPFARTSDLRGVTDGCAYSFAAFRDGPRPGADTGSWADTHLRAYRRRRSRGGARRQAGLAQRPRGGARRQEDSGGGRRRRRHCGRVDGDPGRRRRGAACADRAGGPARPALVTRAGTAGYVERVARERARHLGAVQQEPDE